MNVIPIDQSTPRSKFNIHTPESLKAHVETSGRTTFLVDGIFPEQSLNLLVGDSGLGKSPLLYQLAVCVASGVPFLGREVLQGRALYMDCENGLQQVGETVERVSRHLGLDKPPEDVKLWNLNDCPGEWTLEEIVDEVKPRLVIADPASAVFPGLEEKTDNANTAFQRCRAIMQEHKCSVILVHHVRKGSQGSSASQALEHISLQQWFEEARGVGAIKNGTDVRLGIGHSSGSEGLLIRGFARMCGELPRMHLLRVFDDGGEPMGYDLASGLDFLNPDQRGPFQKLPQEFRFKEAKEVYGKGDQATTDFLKKCIGAGLLIQPARGAYRKIERPAAQEARAA